MEAEEDINRFLVLDGSKVASAADYNVICIFNYKDGILLVLIIHRYEKNYVRINKTMRAKPKGKSVIGNAKE